jgi:hypothetical protein
MPHPLAPPTITPDRSFRAFRQRFLWPHMPVRWFERRRRRKGRGELATKVLIFAHGRVGSTALQSCFPPAETA